MPIRSSRAAAALVALGVLVLAGCTAAPRTSRPDAAPTVAASATTSTSPTACASPAGAPAAAATPGAGETALPTYWHARATTVPTGAASYTALPHRSTIARTVNAAPAGSAVAFAAGTFSFHDFAGSGANRNGALIAPTVQGLLGSGTSATTFTMVPGSSTAAGAIPKTYLQTNQLSLLRAGGAGTAGLRLSGFTVQGTRQGHLYNGLRVDRADRPRITDLRVRAIPGQGSKPPGETFGIDDYRTTHATYARVEVDGSHIGSVGFGANGSSDITVEDSYFHDMSGSMGASFWTVHDATITDVIATDDHRVGLNFERVTGKVVITRPVLLGNGQGDMRIDSDRGSADYTIVDPVYSGRYFTVVYPNSYYGHTNTQVKSSVRLIVHGVDRTKDLLRFTCPTGNLCTGHRTTVAGDPVH